MDAWAVCLASVVADASRSVAAVLLQAVVRIAVAKLLQLPIVAAKLMLADAKLILAVERRCSAADSVPRFAECLRVADAKARAADAKLLLLLAATS